MKTLLNFAAGVLALSGLGLTAIAQDGSSAIEKQLKKDYPVTRVGVNGTVVQVGTVLTVLEDGIKAIPSTFQGYLANNVKKGSKIKVNMIQKIGGGGPGVYLREARFFDVGEKVYLAKVELHKDTEIIFSVQSCGNCNPAAPDPIPPYRAALAFEFPKGYLATASYKDVQELIAHVFAVAPGAPSASEPAPGSPAAMQAAAPPPPAPAGQPPTLSVGQTRDQVVSAIGQPERTATVGNKEILFYKDLKVTLVDGKVSDIQ
jgi:hypothetical protein